MVSVCKPAKNLCKAYVNILNKLALQCIWIIFLCILFLFFKVPWQGTGGNEKFFFENENVCMIMKQNSRLIVTMSGKCPGS